MTTEIPLSRIDALVRLLGDDDPKIASVAWENLEKIGEDALPQIRSAAEESSDLRVRAQCGRFLTEWSRREVFRQWVEFCKGTEVDLEEGAFLIARSEYPAHDTAQCRRTLDGYAQVLRGRLATARTTDEAVRRACALLFHELGYRGNAKDYYNPENSYLNRVLETRRGIPISLAAVFLLTARRAQIPVFGVGLPLHFLLKYRGQSHDVFVDVFHSGALLTARDCARMLSEAEVRFREEYLHPVNDREILKRMLGNLLQIYSKSEDARRADRIAAMLKLLS